MTLTTTPCRHCGKELQYQPIPGLAIAPTLCAACAEAWRVSQAEAILSERAEQWRRLCPAEYATTNLSHPGLAHLSDDRKQSVIHYGFNPPGLLIHGLNRRGKTRLAWLAIHQQMQRGCSGAWCMSAKNALDCYDAGVVLIDDLGHASDFDSEQAAVFELIEYRCANRKKTVITYQGQGLNERFAENRRASIKARFNDATLYTKVEL